MGVRTRSATSSPIKNSKSAVPLSKVEDERHAPLKVLVAPRSISDESRLLLLHHPQDDKPKRFLFCPSNGLFEITKLSTQMVEPRSILFILSDEFDGNGKTPFQQSDAIFSEKNHGYVNEYAEIFTATPFDIVFLLLRLLSPRGIPPSNTMFQPLDDLVDIPDSKDKHLVYVLKRAELLVEEGMSRICDTLDAGGEKMYRYSEQKVLQLLFEKAVRVVRHGLPKSMEEHFVTRTLEAPVMSVARDNSDATSVSQGPPQQSAPQESFDSQPSTTDSDGSVVFTDTSTRSTISDLSDHTNSLDFHHLQRIRTAFNFIASSCLPRFLSARLQKVLSSSTSPINLQPLDEHLAYLTKLRMQAAASRSLSDFSRKRGLDDDEAGEAKAEKKRKQEEEERKRKANESRGVRNLKKVDVTGMQKMSHFFTKKPVVAKAKS